MSRYIATRAIRGSNALVMEAELMLHKALKEKGPDTLVEFPNTAYFLPTIYAMTGVEVTTLGQLEEIIAHARALLHPIPAGPQVVLVRLSRVELRVLPLLWNPAQSVQLSSS